MVDAGGLNPPGRKAMRVRVPPRVLSMFLERYVKFDDFMIDGELDFSFAYGSIENSGTVSVEFSYREQTVAPLASVTKLFSAIGVLVAVEEGSISLDDDVTLGDSIYVKSLLSHTSGLAPEGIPSLNGKELTKLGTPGVRRIYSNLGYEVLALYLEESVQMTFADYIAEAIIEPCGMQKTRFLKESFVHDGRGAAAGLTATVEDLVLLVKAMVTPSVLSYSSLELLSKPFLPGIPGVLPGFGLMKDNLWSLGAEIKDSKRPHWGGTLNSPSTFGHFGRSGSLVWIDPENMRFLVFLSLKNFGKWAVELWPRLSDWVIQQGS